MTTKDVTDKMVCEAYAESARQRGPEWKNNYEFPYEILQRTTGQCLKVCYKAMERACERRLVECGVSLRTGWLTDLGEALIAQGKD